MFLKNISGASALVVSALQVLHCGIEFLQPGLVSVYNIM